MIMASVCPSDCVRLSVTLCTVAAKRYILYGKSVWTRTSEFAPTCCAGC